MGFNEGFPKMKYWLGKKRSEKTRKKISESLKGRVSWNKGKKFDEKARANMSLALKKSYIEGRRVPPMKGRTHSLKTKIKISRSLQGRNLSNTHIINRSKSQCGESHYRWKGGISKKIYTKMRRTLLRQLGGYTVEKIQSVYEFNIKEFGQLTCIYCLKRIEFGKDIVEHKIPLSRGGNNDFANLAISCRPCNTSKGNKTPEEYKIYLEKKNVRI